MAAESEQPLESSVCRECGTSMQKLSGGLVIWYCPKCKLRYVSLNYGDIVPEGFGLTQEGSTFESVDGLPTHESRVDFTPEKDLFEQETTHKEGEYVVKRRFKLHAPYRRRAGNAQKQREERDCIFQILPEFNQVHQSGLTIVTSDPNDAEADVIATDATGTQKILFQVVSADHAIWRRLAGQSAELYEQIPETELFGVSDMSYARKLCEQYQRSF
jgi:hypothetical protein